MPGTVADGPSVPASFANNFWGKDDAGVHPLLERMHSAKVTSDELKAFYNTRAAIEDEYARKLLALARKPLGSSEAGTLRMSLDVVRGEVEAQGKAHAGIAAQVKSGLEEPLAAFAGGLKERRKIVQQGVEKLLKIKQTQTASANKSRDKFERECLQIKGYLAQGHMVMGQEERKNKAKLEKTQIQMASTSNEYEAAIKCLEETTGRWNKDWKAACDKFQDLEEERLDFSKSSLWEFANIASTVCVSDDSSCERIRLSLESCEVEKDISTFIRDSGTGQEIPDPPKYINFCRGDINDSASEASEDENYSVAQFQRTINPAFRTSSPAPSTLDSHHDPNSDLARQMGAAGTDDQSTPKATPQKPGAGAPQAQPDFRRQAAQVQAAFHQQGQDIQLAAVPHNEYPADGMTMFCRTDQQSERSSNASPLRPSSRDSQSEYSNPTSFSSVEPTSGKASPTKPGPSAASQPVSPNKPIQKKRSGFFSNSPFRRRSKHEKERPQSAAAGSVGSHPARGGVQTRDFATNGTRGTPDDLEPVDPRASFQLNVGSNVFDVASPDASTVSTASSPTKRGGGQHRKPGAPPPALADDDPIAAALAELKGVGKQSSTRVSADRYHGLATPAPGPAMQHPGAATAKRGTPPPGYSSEAPGSAVRRLDAPQPAHTAAQMHATARKYAGQNADMFGGGSRPGTSGGPARDGRTSPAPFRSTSPRPPMGGGSGGRNSRQDANMRATSPGPGSYGQQGANSRSRYHSQPPPRQDGALAQRRSASPQPQYARQGGPMALQLRPGQDGGALGHGGRGGAGGRPVSYYSGAGGAQGGHDPGAGNSRRERSKSLAGQPQPQWQQPQGRVGLPDGTQVLHHAQAIYAYNAAIPEELTFARGDVLAVLRLQDDGWWEAEVVESGGRRGAARGRGLVPSNYLQPC